MRNWTTLGLSLALLVAAQSPAGAADPPTLERYQASAARIAPPYPTFPGKTRCVCQDANPDGNFLGYLNSYVRDNAGDLTVNLVCAYPVFTPGVGVGYCGLFDVIK